MMSFRCQTRQVSGLTIAAISRLDPPIL